MQSAPIPANEAERLAALLRYEVLDTSLGAELDDFTLLASQICDTPIALVSLVDEARQWFPSRVGLDLAETPREQAFCTHTFESRAMLVVPNTIEDERFATNPLVTGDPRIRFYAGAPLITSDGYPLGTLCVLDRTPRTLTANQRQALDALSRQVMRQLEHRLTSRLLEQQRREQDAIVNSVADGLHCLNLAGTIMLQNPAARRMLCPDGVTLLGESLHSAVHHHHADGSAFPTDECPIQMTLADGETRTVSDDLFWRTDGTSVPVEYVVSSLTDETGTHIGAIVAFRDVSERRELERLKREFVSTVSHELRTPLTSIRGALGLVVGGALGELSPRVRSTLEIAVRNSERLGKLVDDILDLEKLEAGGGDVPLAPVHLPNAMRQALDATEGYALRYGVTVQLVGDVPDIIMQTNEARLSQVVINLISNAIKYSPQNGVVEVSVRREGGVGFFRIRDHGPGVPDAFRSRLFARFAQAGDSDAQAKSGTGLGLSISRALVEALGGAIGFENHVEGGAEFFFTLPAPPADD